MTDATEFARQAERELHAARRLAPATCLAWRSLPTPAQAAFAPALAFLGWRPDGLDGESSAGTVEADRVAAGRLMLLKLGLDGADPRWSSGVLEDLVRAAVGTSGGTVGDLVRAAYGLLGDYRVELSASVAYFIRDLVVTCYTRHRPSYDAADWPEIAREITAGATPAQLYLALHAVPPGHLPADLERVIVERLAATPYGEEAARALAG